MPFTSRWEELGPTSPCRLPQTVQPYVLHITDELNRLCVTHDLDYVLHILDAVTQGLQEQV